MLWYFECYAVFRHLLARCHGFISSDLSLCVCPFFCILVGVFLLLFPSGYLFVSVKFQKNIIRRNAKACVCRIFSWVFGEWRQNQSVYELCIKLMLSSCFFISIMIDFIWKENLCILRTFPVCIEKEYLFYIHTYN